MLVGFPYHPSAFSFPSPPTSFPKRRRVLASMQVPRSSGAEQGERRCGMVEPRNQRLIRQRAGSFNLYIGGRAGAASTVARLYGFRDHALSLQN